MTLLSFLGIGVARGGSTWLHELLVSNPDVYMPNRRKEIRSSELAAQYRAIGEISPQYYRCEECPE